MNSPMRSSVSAFHTCAPVRASAVSGRLFPLSRGVRIPPWICNTANTHSPTRQQHLDVHVPRARQRSCCRHTTVVVLTVAETLREVRRFMHTAATVHRS